MDVWFALYVALSLVSTLALLSSPYLRITSLGWLIAMWTLPYIGALAFILTVVRARKTSHDQAICHLLKQHQGEPCHHGKFEQLGMHYDFLPYFHMDESEVLRNDEFVDALCSAIESATSRVWITTYILSGEVKEKIIQRLVDAHERGVDVCLLIDRIGSGLLFKPRDNPLGLDLPFEVSIFHQSRVRAIIFAEKRLHSKIALVDHQGFIGSHNLRDEVMVRHDDSVHNFSLRFSGSVTQQLEAVFIDLWKLNTGVILASKAEHDKAEPNPTQSPARIIFSDPIERAYNYNAYLGDMFYAATERICIWMPYIIPSHAMRRNIIAASKMGLDVRVLFPKKCDSALVDNAHALVLKEFIDNGVTCALSEGDFDHSKILVVDDIAVIGSTNLDFRSLYRNYEANIEVNDKEFSASILALFDQAFETAEAVDELQVSTLAHMRNQLTSLIAALY